jgi:hypothetical protein
MYAVEFEASVENGIVHIPKQYQELQQNPKVRFVAMYESMNNTNPIDSETKKQLDEFDRLTSLSNNKVMATMELATNIDDLVLDGIL